MNRLLSVVASGVAIAWVVALLLAVISLVGLTSDVYARETAAWTAQAIGQDWFDLLIGAPWLALCGYLARTGSWRWRALLAGGYAYTMYELVIYAFGVHFNALFLVYCATLGVSTFAFIALVAKMRDQTPRIGRRAARIAGGFLIAVGAIFAALWLSEDLPGVLANAPSQELVEVGLFTNPVHVIDLSFVLPAHIIVGVLLWRRRKLGELYAPIILAFGMVMAASIAGMMLVIGGALPVVAILTAIAVATAFVLARLLRASHYAAVAA
jgi:hypothetical protein